MSILNSAPKVTKGMSRPLVAFIISLLLAFMGGCGQPSQSNLVNIDRLAPLGKPPANEILWSPVDQNKILVSSGYVNFSGGENYILDIETGEKQILAQADYGFLSIRTWLPDGKSLIMAADKGTTGFEEGGLWEISLVDNTMTFLQPKTFRIISGPDNKGFTLARSGITETEQEKTELVWTDRTLQMETVIFATEPNRTILGFSWSPSGEQLAFSMGDVQPKADFHIFVLDLQSGKVKQITKAGDNTYPVWSPVDDLIAYRKKTIEKNQEVFSLHLVDPNGICDIELHDTDYLLSPTWSPNGNLLAFIEPNENGILVANIRDFLAGDYEKWCP